MNCSKDKASTEESCRDQFSDCSDNVDEEDEENIQGLPDVPGVDLPTLIQSGDGNIFTSDGKKQLSVKYQVMLRVFLVTTIARTQRSRARSSSMTVLKIFLSNLLLTKLQFHKEVAAQMILVTAIRPILPAEVVPYQKVMTKAAQSLTYILIYFLLSPMYLVFLSM